MPSKRSAISSQLGLRPLLSGRIGWGGHHRRALAAHDRAEGIDREQLWGVMVEPEDEDVPEIGPSAELHGGEDVDLVALGELVQVVRGPECVVLGKHDEIESARHGLCDEHVRAHAAVTRARSAVRVQLGRGDPGRAEVGGVAQQARVDEVLGVPSSRGSPRAAYARRTGGRRPWRR